MSESKHAKILRLLKTKLTNMRADGESEDPTTREFGNCFALLSIPEDTRPEQVSALATKARATAAEVLRTILKGDADAALVCTEFSTRFSQAAESLNSAAKVETHLNEIRAKRTAALRAYAAELKLAGASDPGRALMAKAERLGFVRSERDAAVRAVAGDRPPPPPPRGNPPPKESQERVRRSSSRRRVGILGLIDLAPLGLSAGMTTLVLSILFGAIKLPKPSNLGADPAAAETGASAIAPPESVEPSSQTAPDSLPSAKNPPVIRDVILDVDDRAKTITVRIQTEAETGNRLQFKYRFERDSPAWMVCEEETVFPFTDKPVEAEFQVVDSNRQKSNIVRRTLPGMLASGK